MPATPHAPRSARSSGRAGRAPATAPVGFTLIEAIVVVAMIAIVAAVAAPMLRAPGGREAAASVRELAAALREARNAAVDRGLDVAFDLDTRTGAYVVVTVPSSSGAPDTIHAGRIPVAAGATTIGCGAARCVVTFDPLRRVRGGPIRVLDESERYDVTAHAWTSIVQIRRR